MCTVNSQDSPGLNGPFGGAPGDHPLWKGNPGGALPAGGGRAPPLSGPAGPPQSHRPAGSGLWVLASGKAQAHSGSCFGAARGKSLRRAQTAAVSGRYSSLDAARVVGSAEPSTCPIKPPGVELNGQQRAWLFRTLRSVIESSQPQRLDLGSAPTRSLVARQVLSPV